MKHRIQFQSPFLMFVVILLTGCSGCSGYKDMSTLIHPYISEEALKSIDPIAVAPFPEPSLERLVSGLKSELNLTEAEIAATKKMIAEERLFDNLNSMDSRRDVTSRQAEFDRRKRMVVAKPELLWTFGFILPPTLDPLELKATSIYEYGKNYLYDYTLTRDLSGTKSGEARYNDLVAQWQQREITDLEYKREWAALLAEENDSITIAKSFYFFGGIGTVASQVALEYAELAIREIPDSFEARHVWALCNRKYYLGTDDEKVISGFRQLVERFPNSSIANFELAGVLPVYSLFPVEEGSVSQNPYVEEALGAIQRAIQLDDRIDPNNETLGACYLALGEYEKALAVYQGMSEVYYGHAGGLVSLVYEVQAAVSELRQQAGD